MIFSLCQEKAILRQIGAGVKKVELLDYIGSSVPSVLHILVSKPVAGEAGFQPVPMIRCNRFC